MQVLLRSFIQPMQPNQGMLMMITSRVHGDNSGYFRLFSEGYEYGFICLLFHFYL